MEHLYEPPQHSQSELETSESTIDNDEDSGNDFYRPVQSLQPHQMGSGREAANAFDSSEVAEPLSVFDWDAFVASIMEPLEPPVNLVYHEEGDLAALVEPWLNWSMDPDVTPAAIEPQTPLRDRMLGAFPVSEIHFALKLTVMLRRSWT